MKYIATIIITCLLSSVFATEYGRVSSDSYSTSSSTSDIDKLKHYIHEGKRILADFQITIREYEVVLIRFSNHRRSCRSRAIQGQTYGGVWARVTKDCTPNKIDKLKIKLKNIGRELDTVETKLLDTKDKIKFAKDVIAGQGEKQAIANQAESVLARIRSANTQKDKLEGMTN